VYAVAVGVAEPSLVYAKKADTSRRDLFGQSRNFKAVPKINKQTNLAKI
jgi:hypothetical protein